MICASHVDNLVDDYNGLEPLVGIDERERVYVTKLFVLAFEESSVNAFMKAFNHMICASHIEHLANNYSWHWWERERERERESLHYKTLCILAFKEPSVNASMEAF